MVNFIVQKEMVEFHMREKGSYKKWDIKKKKKKKKKMFIFDILPE